jgi:GNAT superfamily N-acetyltransferase
MSITFQHLTAPTPDEIAQVRALYESNFPPVMRKPFRQIAEGSHSGDVTLLVARDDAQPDRIVGMATLAALAQTPALYLGYLATDPQLHNQGVGGALFEFVVARMADLHRDKNAMVWEVEAPEADPNHLHNRRIRFYERHGARVVRMANTYRMPDNEGGEIPLRLMWIPLRGRTHPPDRAEVAAWITDIYALVYSDSAELCAQLIAELDDSQPEA